MCVCACTHTYRCSTDTYTNKKENRQLDKKKKTGWVRRRNYRQYTDRKRILMEAIERGKNKSQIKETHRRGNRERQVTEARGK
jgi:hypothetical protein